MNDVLKKQLMIVKVEKVIKSYTHCSPPPLSVLGVSNTPIINDM
jgi:hypothetical protein